MALTRCPGYEDDSVRRAVSEVLDHLGGMKRWISPGNTVFIKPNMLTAKKPERAVTTHPAVVEAIVREVQRAGGSAVVGDSPAGVLSSINRY